MTPIRMERVEAGVRTVIAFTEAFNRRELTGMLQLVSESCVFEPASLNSEPLCGKAAISCYWQEFFTCFPQAHLKIEEAFGFGMRCLSRWSCERVDASGTTLHLRGVDLFRIQDGLIIEHFSYIKA